MRQSLASSAGCIFFCDIDNVAALCKPDHPCNVTRRLKSSLKHPHPFPACRVYARESKKIKAKAIDSNTTALDESKAEQEVSKTFPAMPSISCRQPIAVDACAGISVSIGKASFCQRH